MKKLILILLTTNWYLTSILGLPIFLSLSGSFFFIYIWSNRCKETFCKKIIPLFFTATVLMGYCSYFKIYQDNINILLSILISALVINFGSGLFLTSEKLNNYIIFIKSNKYVFFPYIIIFIALLIYGSFLSIRTGISFDESIEQQTFVNILDAISRGLSGSKLYLTINEWTDRYYGVGFYFPAYLFHKPFASIISAKYNISDLDGLILSRHIAVYCFFALSSLLVARIIYLLSGDLFFSLLSSLAYLLYPYLNGHAMINVKDTPFSVVWLICSYYLLIIVKSHDKDSKLYKLSLQKIFIFTAWLITIRVSGILFFVPIIAVFLYIIFKNGNVSLIKIFYNCFNLIKTISTPLFFATIFICFLYPVAWQSPIEFISGISYMSRHPWDGCTLTFGECLHSKTLPFSYIPLWLLVKLPFVVIAGIFILPVILMLPKLRKKTFLPLLLLIPILLIYFILWLRGAVLYDEVRQVLFSIGIFFIVGTLMIYYLSRLFAIILVTFTLIFFVVDDINIYPYQYAWFNEVSRFFSPGNSYETDYWGTSLRRLAIYGNKNRHKFTDTRCVYSGPSHLFNPFLDKRLYDCIKNADEVNNDSVRPFFYVANVRNGRSILPGCDIIYSETIKLFPSKSTIVLGSFAQCR